MRRDYFTLELANVADGNDDQPTFEITFEGPEDVFAERLATDGAVDVAFRYRTPVDETDAGGVFSVTDRLTGDFVFELNADATNVDRLVEAAREYGQASNGSDDCYTVRLYDGDQNEAVFEAEKRTLLVYDEDGDLLRQHSLIPSGVEL